VQIEHAELSEIAEHDDLRAVALRQFGDVVEGLTEGVGPIFFAVFVGRFVLDEEFSGPKQVNETFAFADAGDAAFVAGEVSAFEVEDAEEGIPEGVRFAFFVALFGPFEREMGGFGFKTFLESHRGRAGLGDREQGRAKVRPKVSKMAVPNCERSLQNPSLSTGP